MDEPSTALETACAAEGMGEGGIGSEVFVDGIFLLFGRALSEAVDYGGNFLDWIVHGDFKDRRARVALVVTL